MRRRRLYTTGLYVFALAAAGCSGGGAPGEAPDAARADASLPGPPPDAGDVRDAASEGADAALEEADAAAPSGDAAVADAGVAVPLPGFGAVSGACGVLDDGEWLSAAPVLFEASVDFGTEAYAPGALSPDAQRVANTPNAGGSSVESEAVSADLLVRCELGRVLKTETEVGYTVAGSKKTDILMEIDGRKVGVSVTRGYHFPEANPYTTAEAITLLTRKLGDLPIAQMNAEPADAWVRSILYVLAYSPEAATAMAAAWAALEPAVRGDAIMIVVRTDGDDAFIY